MLLIKKMKQSLTCVLGLCCFGLMSALQAAGGMGFDVASPIPVADFDMVSDESSFNISYLNGSGDKKNSDTLAVNYGLKPWKTGQLSTSLFVYQSEFNNGQSKLEATELQLSLYYNRHLIKVEEDRGFIKGWRPSRFALSSFFGLGWATSKIDVNASAFDPIFSNFNANLDSANNAVVNAGLVANWSVFLRHGISTHLNIDQHFKSGDTNFGSYKPTVTVGFNYHYRLDAEGFFPPEVVLGLLTSTQSNDVDDGNLLGVSLGYTVRY